MIAMQSLSSDQAEFLLVLARRIVPEVAFLDDAGMARFSAHIDNALGEREEAIRKKFATFLNVIRWAPVVRFGRPFTGLEGARQDRVLRWFEDNPVGLLRSGFWGLKAMVFLGYYGQPEVHAEVGYAPSFDGGGGLHA